MGAVSILFADYLNLSRIGWGTIFEATTWNYRLTPGQSAPELCGAVGLGEAALTRGLTEFGTAAILLKHAPGLIPASIESLAAKDSEKQIRKRALVEVTQQYLGGAKADLSSLPLPKKKEPFGATYAVDFLALLFVRMCGAESVSRWVDGLDQIDFEALDKIDVNWAYKFNPLFIEDIPAEWRPSVLRRMQDAGVEPFADSDWGHYRALRDVLARRYNFDSGCAGDINHTHLRTTTTA